MPTRERYFLLMTIVGFTVANAMVAAFIIDNGVDLGQYFGDWYRTLPAAQLTLDLAICFWAFVPWAAWEARSTGQRNWWYVVPASLLVGLCFAIPLYLWQRERALGARPSADPATA